MGQFEIVVVDSEGKDIVYPETEKQVKEVIQRFPPEQIKFRLIDKVSDVV